MIPALSQPGLGMNTKTVSVWLCDLPEEVLELGKNVEGCTWRNGCHEVTFLTPQWLLPGPYPTKIRSQATSFRDWYTAANLTPMSGSGTVLSLEHSRPKSRELNWDNGGGTRSPHSKNSIQASCGRLAYCLIDSCWKSPKQFIQQQWEKQNRTYGEVTEDTSSPLPQTAQRMLVAIHSSGPWEMRVAEGALPTHRVQLLTPTAPPKSSPSEADTRACTGGLFMTYCWCLSGLTHLCEKWPPTLLQAHRPPASEFYRQGQRGSGLCRSTFYQGHVRKTLLSYAFVGHWWVFTSCVC